jgi:cell division protein FtsB
MRQPPAPPKTPRPIAAFFVSLAGSALVLTMLVLSDGRVLELKKAREDARQLDLEIARLREQNRELRASVDAARRHEFPAEKVAREELHLVHPEDLVLLYPDGNLSGKGKSAVDGRRTTAPKTEPNPR